MAGSFHEARTAYKLRLRRKRLLWRALRARHRLTSRVDRSSAITPGTILSFATVRNEAQRLPYFLEHHRALGVGQFLIVDNMSDDGTAEFLAEQPDVSLWQTGAGYKAARFGMDWVGWLLMRYGHGHWCLTLDADELLVFPHMPKRDLHDLTGWLDAQGAESFGAMMLDLYPQGPLSAVQYEPGQDPTETLPWFDADNYRREFLPKYRMTSIRGGVRQRVFFPDTPEFSAHLHKVPLVRWNRRYAYASSTHSALPRRLNAVFDPGLERPSGVLLHTKFLPGILDKSAEEKHRREHFTHAERYDDYYDALVSDPVLWSENSVRYTGSEQLEELGLMSRGNWV